MVKLKKPKPSADEALRFLLEGNRRFVESALHPQYRGTEADSGQSGEGPFATIVIFGDSEIAPESIFDQHHGAIFVVRVAGLPAFEHTHGSIEYAVSELQTPLVVVLGLSADQEGAASGSREQKQLQQAAVAIASSEPVIATQVKNGNTVVIPANCDPSSGVVSVLQV